MKTLLEIFYLRIVGDRVRYERKQANLSKKRRRSKPYDSIPHPGEA